MRTSNLKPLVRVMFIVCVLAVVAGAALIPRGQGTPSKLPPGNWTFSAGPYSGAGYRSLPVRVFSVTTNAARGLTIESVSLFNRSSKDIRGVKVHWYLKEQSQQQTLLEGDTELPEVNLPAGSRLAIDHPVVSFERIYKSLMRGGVLEGNYRIDVAVNEINFVDGSRWIIGEPGLLKFAHVSTVPVVACMDYACQFDGESFHCVPSKGEKCVDGGAGMCTTEACLLDD
jgi:hypothetical protein